jgi:hypothetical protein
MFSFNLFEFELLLPNIEVPMNPDVFEELLPSLKEEDEDEDFPLGGNVAELEDYEDPENEESFLQFDLNDLIPDHAPPESEEDNEDENENHNENENDDNEIVQNEIEEEKEEKTETEDEKETDSEKENKNESGDESDEDEDEKKNTRTYNQILSF